MSINRRKRIQQPFDYLQKIIIIGDSGVGKSKFVQNYMMTIGINYVFKVIQLDKIKIKLQIWDTAGQDKYKTITHSYYRNSQGVLIVFSIDCRDSFESVKNWIEDLSETVDQTTQVMIVGNKKDLDEKRVVSEEQARLFAAKSGFQYMQCSAKNGESINQVFYRLAVQIKERIIDVVTNQPSGQSLQQRSSSGERNKCYCNM